MAEVLLFDIPQPLPGQDPAYRVLWFQGDDGVTWDLSPVDTILVSDLPIDTNTGKYRWDSQLADPARYHLIKTESQTGVQSVNGFVVAPRPQVDVDPSYSTIDAEKISDGISIYNLGQTVDLMLQIEKDAADVIGDTITVHISDPFETVLSELTANKIGDNLYIAQYTIPKTLDKIYNPYKLKEDNTDYYFLNDKWILPDSTILEYTILVNRFDNVKVVEENSLYTITISNEVVPSVIPTKVEFTSEIKPFYATVDDVISIARNALEDSNILDITKQIMDVSNYVDTMLKPDVIYNEEAYNAAVHCFVKLQSALNLLEEDLRIDLESKQLDTFQITKQYNSDRTLKNLQDKANRCMLVILAGGLDTPYTSKTFQKGIYDPNRPNYSRANLDVSGSLPWVNITTAPFLITTEYGDTIEVRGVRTISSTGVRDNGLL